MRRNYIEVASKYCINLLGQSTYAEAKNIPNPVLIENQ